MSDYRELLIGCGSQRVKSEGLPSTALIRFQQRPDREGGEVYSASDEYQFRNLTTLDINPSHKPDVLFNLERIDGEPHNQIPLHQRGALSGLQTPDSHYDEIHAYEVLEHIGKQGDYRKFFDQFSEFWRILKPDGLFFATVPSWRSEWAWGDPSHTRIITPGSLAFLSQLEYRKQVGKTPMSDFRWCYKADLVTVYCRDDGESHCFVLQAVK